MFSLIDMLDLVADDMELSGLHFIFTHSNIQGLEMGLY